MKKTSIKKSYVPLSVSLIAGALLAAGPKQTVVAQEPAEQDVLSEIKALEAEYHSLLQEVHNKAAAEETAEEATEAEELSEPVEAPASTRVADYEEINEIKQLLLRAIEKAGSTEFVEQLQAESLTVEDLDLIFEKLILNTVETAENTSLEEESEIVTDETVNEEEAEPVEDLEEDTIEEPAIETAKEATEAPAEAPVEEAPVEETAEEQVKEPSKESAEKPEEQPKAQTAALARTMSAAPAASSQKNSSTITYTVRSGDTLNKIARQYGLTADYIASLNNLPNKNNIQVGQTLLISGSQEDLDKLNRPLTNTEFIDTIGAHAREIAGNNNLYASVMVAQAALESGFGKSTLSSAPNHNLFGIKGSYKGESVTMRTREYSNRTGWVTINDAFKKYPSYRESLLDNAYLLRNGTSWDSNFYAGTWLENAKTYQEATSWLEGRYATDPTYATKLNNLISTYNLTRFDGEIEVAGPSAEEPKEVTPSNSSQKPADKNASVETPAPAPKPAQKPEVQPEVPVSSGNATYTVKRGDTLSFIAVKHGMRVSELKDLNNLRSDLIIPGQTLQVKEKAVPAPKPAEPAKPEKPVTSSTTTGKYMVKLGDTLTSISRQYGTTVSALKQLNNLRSDLIFVGQTLAVPEPDTAPAPKPDAVEKPAASSQKSTNTYTVKRGDTLSHIALEYGMRVAELKSLNNLSSDLIFVGQSLKVTAGKAEAKPETKPAAKTESASRPGRPTQTSTETYTVKRGDTLSSISRRYNIAVSELKKLNNLTSDLIFVNQKLLVKEVSKTVRPAASSKAAVSSTANTKTTHTVKAGETLHGIARRYNTTAADLATLNKLNNAHLIYVNQTLVVEEKASSAVNKAPAETSRDENKPSKHQVAKGDTLSHIALKYNTTVQSLKEKNKLSSDLIFVGQTLEI